MATVYGINPVLEILRGDPAAVRQLVMAAGKRAAAVAQVLELAALHRIPVETRERPALDRLAGTEGHQGLLALCRDPEYASLERIIAACGTEDDGAIVLLLDGVTDPQNLGALIRSAHCFGAKGVVIPEHRAASISPAVMKASAGTARRVPVARVTNLGQAMETLKEAGFWIYGADAEGGQPVTGVPFAGRIALVMGSEGSGMRPLIHKKCDFILSVPMAGCIDSLNVSVAAGILLYAIFTALKRG